MHAIVELLDKTVFDQFGINYPPAQVILGLLCGTITRNSTTFIILYNEDEEIIAYSTKYYSIMYVEIEDQKYKFKEEVANAATEFVPAWRRYIFADCSVKDQEEILLECKNYITHRFTSPTATLCPGCFSPIQDLVTLPARWKKNSDADTSLLPKYNEFSKSNTNYNGNSYPYTTYVAPKKTVSIFKRKGKPDVEALKVMREKVAALNAKILKEEAELEAAVDQAIALTNDKAVSSLQLENPVDVFFKDGIEVEY